MASVKAGMASVKAGRASVKARMASVKERRTAERQIARISGAISAGYRGTVVTIAFAKVDLVYTMMEPNHSTYHGSSWDCYSAEPISFCTSAS